MVNGEGNMIILVTGDRHWKDYDIIYRELSKYSPGTILVHGAAPGADSLADIAGERLRLNVKPFPSKWHIYKKGAGPIRNQEMLDWILTQNDEKKVLAFHKNIDDSRGTKDMVERAKKAGVEVVLIDR